MPYTIAIIGKGNVGQALGQGLTRAGNEVRYGTKDPSEPISDAIDWAEIVILAVPWRAQKDVIDAAGDSLDGKIVVDVSNVLTESHELAIGTTTSGAEELQKLISKAKVVKAFNTVFAQNMATGHVLGQQLTAFVAGDDKTSKSVVLELAEGIGFDAIDCGFLKSARYLEPLGVLNITLGYGLGMGTDIGTKVIRAR